MTRAATCITVLIGVFLIGGMLTAAPAQADRAADVTGEPERVSIDFKDVDIGVLIKFISELTGTNYVVDPRVQGRVTVLSPTRISVAEALRVFESVLEIHGFASVPAGAVVKIIPAPEARAKNIQTLLQPPSGAAGDAIVTRIFPLAYADALEARNLLAPFVSRNSVILAYIPTNLLIITDVHSNIERLRTIIEVIDVAGIGRELAVIPMAHAPSRQMAMILETMFERGRVPTREGAEPTLQFVADERTNTLVVRAGGDDLRRVRELITLLDQETPRGSERIRVVYLENAAAEEMVKVLQELPQQDTRGEASGSPALFSDSVRITADKSTNSLVIVAGMDDFLVLEDVIRKLDIPRPMVYIESLIMEVNVDKDFSLGTEWIALGETRIAGRDGAFGGGMSGPGGYDGIRGIFPPVGPGMLPTGFSMGIFSEMLNIGGISFPGLAALARAFERDKDVNILSTPQILTLDNQEALITVGKNVPYQTKSGIAGVNESFNTFEYRDVGISLKITPQISKDRLVRLMITQEVTKLETLTDGSSASTERPTTLKRTIQTTVVVPDKNTVVIGGLIDDSLSRTEYKVPCLGDLPGLGWLFKTRSRGQEKTNLFVFITPHVVTFPEEIAALREDKRRHIEGLREGSIQLYPKAAPSRQP